MRGGLVNQRRRFAASTAALPKLLRRGMERSVQGLPGSRLLEALEEIVEAGDKSADGLFQWFHMIAE